MPQPDWNKKQRKEKESGVKAPQSKKTYGIDCMGLIASRFVVLAMHVGGGQRVPGRAVRPGHGKPVWRCLACPDPCCPGMAPR
jgi:hypothetical protein